MKVSFKEFFNLLYISLRRFIRLDALNNGAALSYYSVFALPPILIILISVVGFFWGESEVESRLMLELKELIGGHGAEQVKTMLDKVEKDGSASSTWFGIITLLFSSTVVFYTIQHSLNRFWGISEVIRHGFVKYVIDKFLSLGMLLIFGFFLMISMVVETAITWITGIFHDFLEQYFSFGLIILDFGIGLVINTFLFALMFKFLPDARVNWKPVIVGGLITAVLFLFGQMMIGWHLGNTNFTDSYGPAGAIITIFVWIFYSSQIIFYGGIFTELYARKIGQPIKPVEGKHH